MGKVSWGILSTASIGVEKVIPAMQKSRSCTITALASRDPAKAKAVAKKLRIPKAYGSYEALLADPEIEAIYNPLPNHMHVEWSIKALEAGKHVLCEKPIGLDVAEAQKLLDAAQRFPHLKIMEAFMYRHHPQWVKARGLVTEGGIGQLRNIQSFFSFYDVNPASILSKPEFGGGGLMDIGCYSISLSRFLFDAEPRRVLGIMEYDPKFKVDRLASGLLDFGAGTATFTCSTQLTPYQRVNIFGTEGRVEKKGSDLMEIRFRRCDQYTIQGDLFSEAVLNDAPVPTPLADAVANMKVIEAVVASAKSNAWQTP